MPAFRDEVIADIPAARVFGSERAGDGIPGERYLVAMACAGHRFDGETGASASTDFYGIGFRFLSGDADSVAFVSDIAGESGNGRLARWDRKICPGVAGMREA